MPDYFEDPYKATMLEKLLEFFRLMCLLVFGWIIGWMLTNAPMLFFLEPNYKRGVVLSQFLETSGYPLSEISAECRDDLVHSGAILCSVSALVDEERVSRSYRCPFFSNTCKPE